MCGVDVSQQKRIKDAEHNYYCQPCWQNHSLGREQPNHKYRCTFCGGSFAVGEVYDQDGHIICLGCHAAGATASEHVDPFADIAKLATGTPVAPELIRCSACGAMVSKFHMGSSGICVDCHRQVPAKADEREGSARQIPISKILVGVAVVAFLIVGTVLWATQQTKKRPSVKTTASVIDDEPPPAAISKDGPLPTAISTGTPKEDDATILHSLSGTAYVVNGAGNTLFQAGIHIFMLSPRIPQPSYADAYQSLLKDMSSESDKSRLQKVSLAKELASIASLPKTDTDSVSEGLKINISQADDHLKGLAESSNILQQELAKADLSAREVFLSIRMGNSHNEEQMQLFAEMGEQGSSYFFQGVRDDRLWTPIAAHSIVCESASERSWRIPHSVEEGLLCSICGFTDQLVHCRMGDSYRRHGK